VASATLCLPNGKRFDREEQMIKLIKSKKGDFELPGAFTVDIISFVLLAILVIVFFALSLIQSCTTSSEPYSIESSAESLDLNSQLASILRTPVDIGNDFTVAELGALALYDTSYHEAMNSQLRISFKNLAQIYALKISKGETKWTFGDSGALSGSSAVVSLPSMDFGIIEFTLYSKPK
jgi:hypothetical protein